MKNNRKAPIFTILGRIPHKLFAMICAGTTAFAYSQSNQFSYVICENKATYSNAVPSALAIDVANLDVKPIFRLTSNRTWIWDENSRSFFDPCEKRDYLIKSSNAPSGELVGVKSMGCSTDNAKSTMRLRRTIKGVFVFGPSEQYSDELLTINRVTGTWDRELTVTYSASSRSGSKSEGGVCKLTDNPELASKKF